MQRSVAPPSLLSAAVPCTHEKLGDHFVYGLMNAETHKVFYVGQSTDSQRGNSHIHKAKNGSKTPVHCKIREILDGGGTVRMVKLMDGLAEREARQAEQLLIKMGVLTNSRGRGRIQKNVRYY